MRVLHVCDFHLKYATALARGCLDQGAEVALLTRSHDLEFGAVPGAMRAFVERRTEGRVDHRLLNGRVRDLSRLRELGRMRRSLARFAPHVVHFQEGVTNDARLLFAAGVPLRRYAMTVHDATVHPGDHWSPAQLKAQKLLRLGAGVLFVHSDTIRDEVRAQSSRFPPIVVVPHGVDTPEVSPLPERPALLFFGRITRYKGLHVLLDAMPLIWARVPEATLTIAGSGEDYDHLVLGDPRILVRDEYVPDAAMPSLFAAATCCVLPYIEASQSGVGSHARAYGRPIVASNVGGLPELVGADSGRLVPPGDPVALAEAVIEVLTTPGLAEAMGRTSAEWVGEAGWGRVGTRTLAAYERYLRLRP